MHSLVLENASLLLAVADWGGDIGPSPAGLARVTDRDAANTRKSVLRLVDLGIATYADQEVGLTEAGRICIPALRVVTGEIDVNPEAVFVRYDRLRPSRFNPRKTFDAIEIEALADKLASPVGQIQPLLIRPVEGGDEIVAGERRWRAYGFLIQRGRWPSDRPIACTRRPMSDREALESAIVENAQRVDLNIIEEGEALKSLVDDGRTVAEAAAVFGKVKRWAEIRLQVLRDAPDILKVELIAGTKTLRQVLEAIQAHKAKEPEPRAPLEPTQAEVAEALRPRRPGEGEDLSRAGRERARESGSPTKPVKAAAPEPETREARAARMSADLEPDEATLIGAYMAAVQSYDLAVRNRLHEAGDLAEDMIDAVIWKTHGGTFFGSNESAKRLSAASAATPGTAPIWGQSGEFLVEVDGVRCVVAARRWGGHSMALDCHAVDGDRPFFSNTGYRSHFLRAEPGVALANAVEAWIRGHMATKDGKLKPIDNGRSYADRFPWLHRGQGEQTGLEEAIEDAPPAIPASPSSQIVRDCDPVLECLRRLAEEVEEFFANAAKGRINDMKALDAALSVARQFAPRAVA